MHAQFVKLKLIPNIWINICCHTTRRENHSSEYLKEYKNVHFFLNFSCRCKECGKRFTTQTQCTMHEARHSDLRPIVCSLCTKTFKLACDLKVHLMCHNDVRKYECEQCGKSFRMHSHLTNHRETHNTENKLECDQCGHMFKTSVTLKSHIRQVHTQNHQYKCSVCNRGFYRKNKLLVSNCS